MRNSFCLCGRMSAFQLMAFLLLFSRPLSGADTLEPYFMVDSERFLGHKYYLFSGGSDQSASHEWRQVSWHLRQDHCESLGGYLATITTKAENDFLTALLSRNSSGGHASLGFTDEATEGDWVWVTGEEVTYTNWDTTWSNEPNNWGDEDYGMLYGAGRDGYWNDYRPTLDPQAYFICETGALTRGKIVFRRQIDGQNDLFLINDDGSGLRRLTDYSGRDEEPALSPDGQWVAFGSDRSGSIEIYRMRFEGCQNPDQFGTCDLEQLTSGVSGFEPAIPFWGLDWHPDGTRLIFSSTTDRYDSANRVFKLHELDLETREIRILTGSDLDVIDPSYSFNGNSIYMQRSEPRRQAGTTNVYVSDSNGNDMTLLPTAHRWGSGIPSEILIDGDIKVVFSGDIRGDGVSQIQLMNPYPDLASQTNLSGNSFLELAATTSPNAPNEFIFVSNRGGQYSLWWAETDGSAVTGLFQLTSAFDVTPDWWAPAPNSPPVAVCEDISVAANRFCSAVVDAQSIARASSDPDGDTLEFALNPTGPFPLGDTPVTVKVTDSAGNTDLCQAVVSVFDQSRPEPDDLILPNLTGQCSVSVATVPTATDNCSGPLTGTTSAPLLYGNQGSAEITWTYSDESGNFSSQTQQVLVQDSTPPEISSKTARAYLGSTGEASIVPSDLDAGSADNCSTTQLTLSRSSFICADLGDNTVELTATDQVGNSSTVEATVLVLDEESPQLACTQGFTLSANEFCQAPMPDFAVSSSAVDNCTVAFLEQSILPGSSAGVGETLVIVTATDQSGNAASCSTSLRVVDTTAPTVTKFWSDSNPVALGQSLTLHARITDLCSLIAKAEYSLDGGTSFSPMDPIAEPDTDTTATVTLGGFHESGILSVCVRGFDTAGNESNTECFFLPVFDPLGGFVTGGGWIWSPAGAYAADTSAEGKAAFGFVSKYQKGAQKPSGQTQFHFRSGGLTFHSQAYDWLVVAGAKSIYKGSGTINGAGNFRFMLTAIDGDLLNSGTVDRFRIRIWRELDGLEWVIYDSQPGELGDADGTTPLGGGSIIIHRN